jgi:hypothetical protein
LRVNDSYKLWNIPEGKKVVMEYTSMWQPVGKSRSKFKRMTGKIVRSSGKKVVMEYTSMWQPVGKKRSKFKRMTGKIVRSGAFLRISDNWKKVSKTTKEDL